MRLSPPFPPPEASLPEGKGRGRLQCRVAVDIVALIMDVPASAILSPTRSEAAAARARHVAMYLSHVTFQLPIAAVADGFRRDRTSVAYALARVEDERDKGDFDRMLTAMEHLAQSCRRLSLPAVAATAGEGSARS